MKWLGTILVLLFSSVIFYHTYSLRPHINEKTAISNILKNEAAESLIFSPASKEQIFEFLNEKNIEQDTLNYIFMSFLKKINEVRGGKLIKYTNNIFIAEFSWHEVSKDDFSTVQVNFLYNPKALKYTLVNVSFSDKNSTCAKEFLSSYFVKKKND